LRTTGAKTILNIKTTIKDGVRPTCFLENKFLISLWSKYCYYILYYHYYQNNKLLQYFRIACNWGSYLTDYPTDTQRWGKTDPVL